MRTFKAAIHTRELQILNVAMFHAGERGCRSIKSVHVKKNGCNINGMNVLYNGLFSRDAFPRLLTL